MGGSLPLPAALQHSRGPPPAAAQPRTQPAPSVLTTTTTTATHHACSAHPAWLEHAIPALVKHLSLDSRHAAPNAPSSWLQLVRAAAPDASSAARHHSTSPRLSLEHRRLAAGSADAAEALRALHPTAAATGDAPIVAVLLARPIPDPTHACPLTTAACSTARPPPAPQPPDTHLATDTNAQPPPAPVTAASVSHGAGRVLVCQGGKCQAKGALQVLQAVSAAVADGNGGAPEVQVLPCKCLGACKEGPAMRVKVDGAPPGAGAAAVALHTRLTPEHVAPLLDAHFAAAAPPPPPPPPPQQQQQGSAAADGAALQALARRIVRSEPAAAAARADGSSSSSSDGGESSSSSGSSSEEEEERQVAARRRAAHAAAQPARPPPPRSRRRFLRRQSLLAQQQQQQPHAARPQQETLFYGVAVQGAQQGAQPSGCYVLKLSRSHGAGGCVSTAFTLTRVCQGQPLYEQLYQSWLDAR